MSASNGTKCSGGSTTVDVGINEVLLCIAQALTRLDRPLVRSDNGFGCAP